MVESTFRVQSWYQLEISNHGRTLFSPLTMVLAIISQKYKKIKEQPKVAFISKYQKESDQRSLSTQLNKKRKRLSSLSLYFRFFLLLDNEYVEDDVLFLHLSRLNILRKVLVRLGFCEKLLVLGFYLCRIVLLLFYLV